MYNPMDKKKNFKKFLIIYAYNYFADKKINYLVTIFFLNDQKKQQMTFTQDQNLAHLVWPSFKLYLFKKKTEKIDMIGQNLKKLINLTN
ncbi:hypothetical protein BpHYR1_030783 [Brachionus plicatilis]|uniref:Uncharacterized protein n=1 Tax=Brachionus plicatilis TaxID=10195 RepID=A0A3M7RIZ5_BRAPC|nr:hypothetical protein BpHYR1_030783 [Brachionus plicatilis]